MHDFVNKNNNNSSNNSNKKREENSFSHIDSNHHPSESPLLRAVEPLTSDNPRKAGHSID